MLDSHTVVAFMDKKQYVLYRRGIRKTRQNIAWCKIQKLEMWYVQSTYGYLIRWFMKYTCEQSGTTIPSSILVFNCCPSMYTFYTQPLKLLSYIFMHFYNHSVPFMCTQTHVVLIHFSVYRHTFFFGFMQSVLFVHSLLLCCTCSLSYIILPPIYHVPSLSYKSQSCIDYINPLQYTILVECIYCCVHAAFYCIGTFSPRKQFL